MTGDGKQLNLKRAMKKFYFTLAAVAAIFAGCSKEVDNQTEPVVPKEKTVTLKASVSGLETKVSSDNAGFFKWQNQDAITVVTNKDATSFFNLYNIDNTGTQADFEGAIADGDALKYALRPVTATLLTARNSSLTLTTSSPGKRTPAICPCWVLPPRPAP